MAYPFINALNMTLQYTYIRNIYIYPKYLYPDIFSLVHVLSFHEDIMLDPIFGAFPPGHVTVGAHQTDASPHQMCNPKIKVEEMMFP